MISFTPGKPGHSLSSQEGQPGPPFLHPQAPLPRAHGDPGGAGPAFQSAARALPGPPRRGRSTPPHRWYFTPQATRPPPLLWVRSPAPAPAPLPLGWGSCLLLDIQLLRAGLSYRARPPSQLNTPDPKQDKKIVPLGSNEERLRWHFLPHVLMPQISGPQPFIFVHELCSERGHYNCPDTEML